MQGLKACDISESPFKKIDLPRNIQRKYQFFKGDFLVGNKHAKYNLRNTNFRHGMAFEPYRYFLCLPLNNRYRKRQGKGS